MEALIFWTVVVVAVACGLYAWFNRDTVEAQLKADAESALSEAEQAAKNAIRPKTAAAPVPPTISKL